MFILSLTTIVGILIELYPNSNVTESLYMFYHLGHPAVFVLLWCLMTVDVFFRSKSIGERLCDENSVNPESRVYFYMLFSTLSLGFGLIFGTLGLFATSNNGFVDYLLIMISGMLFTSVTGIIAQGYIRDSPIAEFFTKRITQKFPYTNRLF